MSFFTDASFVMDPSVYRAGTLFVPKPTDGSGDLTFTRSSGATRVGPNGYIEKVRTNLFTYSEQLDNAAWIKADTTITANAIVAPDGTTTADKMTDGSTATAARYSYQSPASSGRIYTSSGYFKKGEYNFVTLHAFGLNGAVFNLDTGVKVSQSGGVGSIESVGNGWYRCSFAFTAGGTSVFFSQSPAGNISYVGTTGSGIYAWGLQVEVGDVMTDYIPTTTTAVTVGPVANIPRLDYFGDNCPKLLLEPQRTNLFRFSEQFNQSFWIQSNTTVTPNTTISPDGYQNADTMTTVASTSRIIDDTVYGAGTYTASVYVKRLTGNDNFQFRFVVDGSNQTQNFTVTSEWQRFTFTVTAVTSLNDLQLRSSAAGTGTFAIWGAQLELGAYATSYIPTLGTSVTRVADDCVKTSATSIIGQTEGVIYINWDYKNSGSSLGNIPICLDGGLGNEVYFYVQSNGNYECEMFVSSARQFIFSGSLGSFGTKKIAIAYKQNDFALYINGVQIGTGTSGSVPAMNRLYVGRFYGNTSYNIASGINQALLFKTRLSNADLARLTSI